MPSLRIALAQINATVGDLDGNAARILDFAQQARAREAQIVAFPELAVTGYPPEDLLLKPGFVAANLESLHDIARNIQGITAIVGFVDQDSDIYNAAAVINDEEVVAVYRKMFLPNYGVFDEQRYFGMGTVPVNLRQAGEEQLASASTPLIGINICEDIWNPAGPTEAQALAGAQVVINISASPYYAGKVRNRERMIATRAADSVVIVAFCNMAGGQDELVFDGASSIFNQEGDLIARARQFEEDLLVADLDLTAVFRQRLHDPRGRQERSRQVNLTVHECVLPVGENTETSGIATDTAESQTAQPATLPPTITPLLDSREEVYRALVLGTADYLHKNGFNKVVIGLSGGVDSTLVAAIAVDALGPENVTGVSMPSRYSSSHSLEDAETLATNFGFRYMTIPIDDTFQAYLEMLAPSFENSEPDVTEENIQARIRGNILMALSNKFGWLVLTTGNKSEMSVGYATLYGDMAGGYAVIKDVPKMLVYDLCRWRNDQAGYAIIPERVLSKAPSAELRPDQKDEDSLPPYHVLDPILEAYVEDDRSVSEIIDMGFDPKTVSEVVRLVDRNEYKRRQAAVGVKITERAFGRDRRLPITNRFRDQG
ncbi:MAG: NAD+ synthase [Chloroflexota bacterium]|nr:NAD+ synthase [Chloroflexota bacterium]